MMKPLYNENDVSGIKLTKNKASDKPMGNGGVSTQGISGASCTSHHSDDVNTSKDSYPFTMEINNLSSHFSQPENKLQNNVKLKNALSEDSCAKLLQELGQKTCNLKSLVVTNHRDQSAHLTKLENLTEKRYAELVTLLESQIWNSETWIGKQCVKPSSSAPSQASSNDRHNGNTSVYLPPSHDLDESTFSDSPQEQDEVLVNNKITSLLELIDKSHKKDLSMLEAVEVFPVAVQYNMKHLTKKLSDMLQFSLTIQNCVQILRLASLLKQDDLLKAAQNVILDNLKEVSETVADFCNLSFKDLNAIVHSDTACATEEHIFYAIEYWILHNVNQRRHYAQELLPAVRISRCSLSFLQDIRNHFLVCDQKTFSHALHQAVDELISANKCATEAWRREPPISRLRNSLKSQDTLYVLGGDDSGGVIEAYGSTDRNWSPYQTSNSPNGYTLAVSIGKTIFVVEVGAKRVRSFDPQKKTWTDLAPMPVFRWWLCLARDSTRVYALGGKGHGATCDYYDTKLDTWVQVESLKRGRVFASATSLRGKIYCCGGESEPGGKTLGSLEVYDPCKGTWADAAPMLGPRWGHCLVSCNHYLWAVGGYIGEWRTNDLVRYNPSNNSWTRMRPMIAARYALSVSMYRGCLYATGGYDWESNRSTELYHLGKNYWSTGPALNRSRYWHASCVVRTE